MASSTALFSIESLFRRIFVSFSVEYSLTILYGKYKLLLIKEQGQELFSRPCFYKTFSIEMINPNYMTHLDNVVRIIITCKGRLKSIFLFLVQKAPQLIKQGRSAQCQLPAQG